MFKKVPYIAQIQEGECGVCCVSMIMNYYNDRILLKTLSNNYPVGRDGHSINDLKDILESYDYKTKLFEASYDMLHNFKKSPVIIYWENSHFVILEKIRNNKYIIIDPTIGRRTIDDKEFKSKYSGLVLSAYPLENRESIKEKSNPFKIYTDYFKKNKRKLALLLVFTLSSYGIIFFSPYLMRSLTSQQEQNGNINFEYFSTIILLCIFIYLFIHILRSVSVINLSASMDNSVYKSIIKKIFSLPYSFFLTRNSSDLLYRLGLTKSNREFLVESTLRGFIDLGLIIIIFLTLFFIGPWIALYTLIFSLLAASLLLLIRSYILKFHREEILKSTKLQSIEYESLTGMFTIKASGQEDFMNNAINTDYDDTLTMYRKRALSNSLFSTIISFFSTFAPLILFFLILISFDASAGLTNGIFAFTLLNIYFQSYGSVFNAYNTLGTLRNNLERITDITEEHSEENTNLYIENERLSSIHSIEFKNVYFKYPGQDYYALEDINLTIRKGEKVAIVGKTGAGKSTILGLLLGVFKPTSGEIYVNGLSISKIDSVSFKELIGFVPQEPFVFNKSIKNNITMNAEYTLDELINAASISRIHEEILKMPMAYETIISESGHNISGGQKQRIILSRALINNPDLIILDEATSSVDMVTEKEISEIIHSNNKTQVIVAHRLATIKDADKIIVLENSSISGEGTHSELLQSNDFYGKLNNQLNKEVILNDNTGTVITSTV